ncbi:hypothetical protein FQN55_008166 [Onygenales sp. PD_40]|nr:hypothetical protein FQN55_008166 [Onygenales sp. PD_40]KAK2782715.1 hypothetical protein FQN53_009640 [Emmonsiellopsis sp. PD_33]KAK2790696.1 hypothetical protein FQN52_005452 [Onygenales sp. PD_12]KAK2796008.1 hypothetical protein FQN51_009554 [Onygenales sp. PD_10]
MLDHAPYLGLIWALWGVGFLTTVGRAILRFKVQKKYVIEDYLALLCFIFLTALTSVITVVEPKFRIVRNYLLDSQTDPLTPPPLTMDQMLANNTIALKLMFSQMLLFWTTLWAGKFSLMAFFRRVVIGLPRYMMIYWVVFVIVMATYLACMLSNFLTCTPLTKYWSAMGCSDPENVVRADHSIKFATGADVAADLLIMLLPLRLLVKVRISAKQKIGLAWMFSLGLIVVAFAFIRLWKVTKATAHAQIDPTTLTEGPLLLSMWSQIEGAVALLVANIPAFRSLITPPGGTGIRPSKPYNRGSSYPENSNGDSRSKSISKPRVRRSSYEMQSLHSDEGSFGSRVELRDERNIVRTTEVAVAVHSRGEQSIQYPFSPAV